MISAQEAKACGLVSKVFPAEELVDNAVELAGRIGKMSAIAVQAAKEAVNTCKFLRPFLSLNLSLKSFSLLASSLQHHIDARLTLREEALPYDLCYGEFYNFVFFKL